MSEKSRNVIGPGDAQPQSMSTSRRTTLTIVFGALAGIISRSGWAGDLRKGASSDRMPAKPAARNSDVGAASEGTAAQFQDLKKLGPDHQVRAIRYRHDTFHVTTADGRISDFLETNLRFKIDSRDTGPSSGKPVIMPTGMVGDRALVFFASPSEIGAFIKDRA